MVVNLGEKTGTNLIEQRSGDLTLEKAVKILIYSFKYSQANEVTQRMIFRFIHKTHPDWKIPNSRFRDDLIRGVSFMAQIYVLGTDGFGSRFHTQMNAFGTSYLGNAQIFEETQIQANAMFEVLTDAPPTGKSIANQKSEEEEGIYDWSTPSKIALKIAEESLGRDQHFLIDKNGRDKHFGNGESFPQDPFASFFIEYVMRGKKTEVAEFDELFASAREQILTHQATNSDVWRRNFAPKLVTVAGVYNLHHPETPFELVA